MSRRSNTEVVNVLEMIGLSQYANIFRDQDIDTIEVMTRLSDDDMASMGMSIGHRIRLQTWISTREESSTTAEDSYASLDDNDDDDIDIDKIEDCFMEIEDHYSQDWRFMFTPSVDSCQNETCLVVLSFLLLDVNLIVDLTERVCDFCLDTILDELEQDDFDTALLESIDREDVYADAFDKFSIIVHRYSHSSDFLSLTSSVVNELNSFRIAAMFWSAVMSIRENLQAMEDFFDFLLELISANESEDDNYPRTPPPRRPPLQQQQLPPPATTQMSHAMMPAQERRGFLSNILHGVGNGLATAAVTGLIALL